MRIAIRFGVSAISGTTDSPPYSKYASSTTTAASGTEAARAAIAPGSTSSPVGLFGLQIQTSCASAGSSVSSAPSTPEAIAYSEYVGRFT